LHDKLIASVILTGRGAVAAIRHGRPQTGILSCKKYPDPSIKLELTVSLLKFEDLGFAYLYFEVRFNPAKRRISL
jgi:hypothetical protein